MACGLSRRGTEKTNWWSDDQETDGESPRSTKRWGPSRSYHQSQKTKESRWEEKTKAFHETGLFKSEKRVSATKTTKVDVKESFEEWKNICDEAEVIIEQKRIKEDELSLFCTVHGRYQVVVCGTSPGHFHESGRIEAKERRKRKEEH